MRQGVGALIRIAMLYEAGRSRWGGAVAATFGASLLVAGAACGGGLEDSGRFEQPPPVLGSVPIAGAGAGGAGDDQMLPVLPASEAVDPLLPIEPSTPDAGSAPLGGAGGTGPVAPIVMPPPACVVDLFVSRWSGLECHGPGAPEVDLISPGVATRLVDRPSSPSLLCAGRTYVATDGSPSLLLDKLRDTPPCGSPMPLRGNIGAQHVDCLVQWVASLQQLSSDFDAGTI